ncbi:hypothetical protein WKK05_06635 [Nostoc sp. UHCC 0302]|uniref:hypothetical protein n=1 Tax=Nostoc sp. UHCC 0302 TaxID=3134896 RepID=UPI00311CC424
MKFFNITLSVIIFILTFFSMLLTAKAGEIYHFKNGLKLYVNVVNLHPFLVDHEKVLIIQDNQKQLKQIPLYADAGLGSPAFLFKQGKDIILIDSNGYWYKFNQQAVLIEKLWKWDEDLPKGFIGIIAYDKQKNDYILIKNKNIAKNDVYRYKDPDMPDLLNKSRL